MTLTLLLDLDGTLIENKAENFVPVYMRVLANHMAPYCNPALLRQTLYSATAEMINNQQPDRTLEEVFDQAFYPILGLERADVQDAIDIFYRDVFPELKTMTKMRPEAIELVEEARRRGYRLGVATNPLFPHTAMIQRLDWAGISPQKEYFDLVSSYESFHFAKPCPAYFMEFLAQMGWPEGPVVMVGNDPLADIIPAREIGFPAFWIRNEGVSYPKDSKQPNGSGSLADFMDWLDTTPVEELEPNFTTPAAYRAVIRGVPAALDSLTRQRPAESWTRRPKPDEWSPVEIACHLRDVDAEVNIPRLRTLVAEANPFLPGMDTDQWADERQYIAEDCTEALDAFLASRVELLALLDQLKPEDWDRNARHAIFGPTSLKEIVGIIAGHDRLHIRQFYQAIFNS